MEHYTPADRLRGALSHPGATVPFVELGQEVWFHRDRHGGLRDTVHSLDGKIVYVRHNGQLFSAHESRTKPFVSRRQPTPPAAAPRLPPAAATARPASAPVAPLRTNTAAPPVSPPLPAASGVFFSPAISPKSSAHPRWDAAKATEIAVFDSIDCKTAISAHSVPAGQLIFYYLWRVTHKPNRGNGKPAERARYCIAGNRD